MKLEIYIYPYINHANNYTFPKYSRAQQLQNMQFPKYSRAQPLQNPNSCMLAIIYKYVVHRTLTLLLQYYVRIKVSEQNRYEIIQLVLLFTTVY